MMEKITTTLITIGDSKGIRIPQHILKRLNFHSQLELIIDDVAQKIHIKPLNAVLKEVESFIPVIPQPIEAVSVVSPPQSKRRVGSKEDFNPWDD